MADIEYLKSLYYDPKKPGSFSGLQKIMKQIRKDGVNLSKKQVKEWLSKQDTYSSLRGLKRKLKRPRVFVYGKNKQWDADTGNYAKWAKENEGYAYFLLCIDIFTRYVWTRPLKTLQGKEMEEVLQQLFQEAGPKILRTDGGSEFNNARVKKLLKDEHIEHIVTLNETKANYAERAIKTIKMKLSKYMYNGQTRKWVKVLDDVTQSYNNSFHRSIGISPAEAMKLTDEEIWVNQYLTEKEPKKKRLKRQTPYKFKIGDQIKLSFLKRPFERAYDQTFTGEVFTITERAMKQGIPVYSIKDYENDPISGHFYEEEMQKVILSDDTVYKIEEILKRRKRGRRKEALVKWMGWPSKFNSWILESEVKDYQPSG